MKSIFRKISVSLCALVAMIGVGLIAAQPVFADGEQDCTTILTGVDCDEEGGGAIFYVIRLAANILVGAIIVLGTIGIIISGVQIMTAGDDPGKVAAGRKRIIEIAIGIAAFALLDVLLWFILPGGSNDGMGIGSWG